MKTVYVTLSIGLSNAERADEIEVEDDATEEQIEEAAREWAHNYIEIGWDIEKPEFRWQ